MVALEELIKALPEPGHGRRVGLADAVDVGADQDQAAGGALSVGGGDAGLGATDLAGKGVALAAELSLEPNVHRGPGRYLEKRGRASAMVAQGERVAQRTATARAERDADRRQVERLEREIAGVCSGPQNLDSRLS